MDQQCEVVTIGLQEGDTCRIITDTKQRIYLKAIKTKNGYVKLEVEMPKRYFASRLSQHSANEASN